MARVVVTSACYLGDVAPFVEPANRLVDRGHDVTFLAPAGFHGVLEGERFSLATYPLDFSARAMQADPRHQRLMRHPFRNQLRLARYWMRAGFTAEPVRARKALIEAIEDADVVVTHPTFGQVVVPVAASLGVPAVVGQLFPMMIPTVERTPPMGWPGRDLGRIVNRASWSLLAAGSGLLMADRAINDHRRIVGREARRGNALLGWTEAARTVTLVSRRYFGDEPLDWDGCELVGFSHWSGPRQESAADVEEFLADGALPVLVCLGTSAASAATRTFSTVGDGIEGLGLRALMLTGHEGITAALNHRPGVFTFAPVAPLMARCRAAVVSGALGTLAAALSAGLPVVVVPQLFDQVWHGTRVEHLGVGIMALRSSQVAGAVARLEADPSYRQRAAELASAMAGEDGARALVETVEATLSAMPR